MKPTLLLALLTAAVLANASGNFSMIEMNPLHGTEEFTWSDSSKHIYGAGELSNFTEFNGSLYYYGQDTVGNEELWKTDGTAQGTKLVKDLNPNGSSQIGGILTVGGKMIFIAADNNNWDFDLFSSDGTAEGTVKIADINEGWNDILSSQRSAAFGGSVLFCTNTALMSTDGTTGGTKTLLSLSQYSPAQGYCELNGFAYFILTDVSGKPQLWKTNGTTAGTQLAFDLGASPNNIMGVERLLTFNGKLYMVAALTGQGYDLFSLDGGELQQVSLSTTGNAYPHALSVVNNQLYFVASNMTHTNLYRLTATDATPVIVPSTAVMDVYGGLTFCNNSVYFTTDNKQQIHSVNLNTLALSTLNLNAYKVPDYWFAEGNILTGVGGKIFFAAYDTATNNQVFVESDGTEAGTFSVMPPDVNTTHPFNVIIGCGAADIFDFKIWGNKVVVPANFNNAGRELWFYEPQGLANAIEPVTGDKMQVKVFPNPTAKVLSVAVENNGYCDKTVVKVSNMNGQVMLESSFEGNSTTLDVSTLAAGNYCLSLTDLLHQAIIRNFVVSK